ncbi:hypothetical protein SUGI_0564780 [Cryptomeria japonica]|nr:hypothetical protein SUGI_0564780 [Cryptomeria japonica]
MWVPPTKTGRSLGVVVVVTLLAGSMLDFPFHSKGDLLAIAQEKDATRNISVHVLTDGCNCLDGSSVGFVEIIVRYESEDQLENGKQEDAEEPREDEIAMRLIVVVVLGVMVTKYKPENGLRVSYSVDGEMDQVKMDPINKIVLLRMDLPRWVQFVVREEWTIELFSIELMRYQNFEEKMMALRRLI